MEQYYYYQYLGRGRCIRWKVKQGSYFLGFFVFVLVWREENLVVNWRINPNNRRWLGIRELVEIKGFLLRFPNKLSSLLFSETQVSSIGGGIKHIFRS